MRHGRSRSSIWCEGFGGGRAEGGPHHTTSFRGNGTIEKLQIGLQYDTTYGTLWKDGTYLPRGTRVLITGLHIEQGFCVRFPAEAGGEPLETWEDWDEIDFLAEQGSVESGGAPPTSVLIEAREVLDDAEDGCHLHLHEDG